MGRRRRGSNASTSTSNRSANRATSPRRRSRTTTPTTTPLAAACKAVKKKFGRGLLLDIHGQAAPRRDLPRHAERQDRHAAEGPRRLAGVRARTACSGYLQTHGYKVCQLRAREDKEQRVHRRAHRRHLRQPHRLRHRRDPTRVRHRLRESEDHFPKPQRTSPPPSPRSTMSIWWGRNRLGV